MEDRYKLLLQRGSESVVNTYDEWGIVCAKVPFYVGGKTKDLPKREWFDEDGDDVYLPSTLRLSGYDAEFEFAYKGKELASNPFSLRIASVAIDDFKEYLLGVNGTCSFKIYSPYSTIGRQGCYLLEISNEDPVVHTVAERGSLYHENVVTFKAKFRVTDPITDIVLEEESQSGGDDDEIPQTP